MEKVRILKILFNILYISLISVGVLGVVFFIAAVFFNEYLPPVLQVFKGVFNINHFGWFVYLEPLSKIIGFILFIVCVHHLKKCIGFFENNDFYSPDVVKRLRSVGRLFVIISLISVLLKFIAAIYLQSIMGNMALNIPYSFWVGLLGIVVASFNLTSIFLLITGLFLLLFSNIFANAGYLKQENDLTI
ncbi:DUF2975 domain-containing protein [Flavobacteriaceae bacterium SZ-1-7]|uniref:DUF2975 domain-containing protein n=1 Tax=Tamlana sedimenti TaxID=3134126 RepID=UPI0031248A6C